MLNAVLPEQLQHMDPIERTETATAFAYVLIENENQYTNNDVRVLLVADSLGASVLRGWTVMVETASKPWTIRFYKDRTGEFSNMLGGVPDYKIERWDLRAGVLLSTHYLGWDGLDTFMFDQLLKRECARCEELLAGWRQELELGRVPAELCALETTVVES